MTRATLVTTIVSTLAACVLAVTAAAAPTVTPAAYRTALNALCRSYTPKLKRLETRMAAALKANQPRTYGVYLGQALVLAIDEDVRIERTPVPVALRTRMAPIVRQLKLADGAARRALTDAVRGDSQGMLSELRAIAKLSPSLNTRLDRAGLRDCGSNQD
jgi:hypothetical protein